jgi:hypothetical protein
VVFLLLPHFQVLRIVIQKYVLILDVLVSVLRLRCYMKPTCPNSKQKCIAHRYSLIEKLCYTWFWRTLRAHSGGIVVGLMVATILSTQKKFVRICTYRYNINSNLLLIILNNFVYVFVRTNINVNINLKFIINNYKELDTHISSSISANINL